MKYQVFVLEIVPNKRYYAGDEKTPTIFMSCPGCGNLIDDEPVNLMEYEDIKTLPDTLIVCDDCYEHGVMVKSGQCSFTRYWVDSLPESKWLSLARNWNAQFQRTGIAFTARDTGELVRTTTKSQLTDNGYTQLPLF